MTAHKPSKPVYSLLGDVTTEITFELPSTRFEIIKGTAVRQGFQGGRPDRLHAARRRAAPTSSRCSTGRAGCSSSGPSSWLWAPPSSATTAKSWNLQREGLKFNPNLMLIQDSDMPAIWYHRVKKAWAESIENGTRIRQSCAGTEPALAVVSI